MNFKIIYDNYHGNVELSALESDLLKSPVINRLHQILQNSTAYLVFPCCKTSRFEHSIGVMDYSALIYSNGLKNSTLIEEYLIDKGSTLSQLLEEESDNIFKCATGHQGLDQDKYRDLLFKKYKVTEYYELLLKPEILDTLINIIGEPFIRRNIEFPLNSYKTEQLFTLITLYQSVRIYGLLHDIGHMPFSHLFEFAIDNVYEALKNKKAAHGTLNKTAAPILTYLESIFKSPATNPEKDQIHEIIGRNITSSIFADIKHSIIDSNISDLEKAKNIFAIECIELTWKEISTGKVSRLASLYKIVSGTMDSDRLDFIQRDGAASGVNKSTGNIDRIIKLFCLSKISDTFINDPYIFVPSIQSLHDVDKVLHDRFNLYKYMVNHHAVRRSDYIFQNGIEQSIFNEISNSISFSKELKVHNLIDTIKTLRELTTSKDHLEYKKLIYKFTQISDFWLLSLFSQRYFENIHSDSNLYKILMSEIFENSRKFKSLWKRSHDYTEVVTQIGQKIISEHKGIITSISVDSTPANKPRSSLMELIKSACNDSNAFVVGSAVLDYLKEVEKNQWCKKIEENMKKLDEKFIFLVVPTKINDGIKELWLIDNKNQENVFKFEEVSKLKEILKIELDYAIKFFAYFCRPESNHQNGDHKIVEKYLVSAVSDLFITNLK